MKDQQEVAYKSNKLSQTAPTSLPLGPPDAQGGQSVTSMTSTEDPVDRGD